MKTIETGGSAFPMQEPQAIHAYAIAAVDGITDSEERDRAYLKARAEAVGGATLRDYFAAKAMQGLLAHHGVYEEEANHFSLCSKKEARRRESSVPVDRVAEYAYITADAMLAARKQNPNQ